MKLHRPLRRLLIWVALPVFLGAGTFLYASGLLVRWGLLAPPHPVLEVPSTLDLGEREAGEETVVRFAVANRGRRQLVIDRVNTSCTCSSLVRSEGDRDVPFGTLRLAAGERMDLKARVQVRVKEVEAPARIYITFHTNDPRRPEATVELLIPNVTGGVTAWPSALTFGTVRPGTSPSRVVQIRDSAVRPRVVDRVTSSDPERVVVSLLPLPSQALTSKPAGGWLIACCEVVLRGHRPGPVEGNLSVHLSSETRPPLLVPVSGQVVGPVEVLPTLLVLPRASEAGPLYHASCLCRSIEDKPFTLTVDPLPEGLKARVDPGQAPNTYLVRVEWGTHPGTQAETARKVVRLRAKVGAQESTLEVPVLCRGAGGGP